MAEVLVEAFGDRIARSPPPALLAHVTNHAHFLATGRGLASPAAAFALAQELLPSPRALAGKVLVKAKLKSPEPPSDKRRAGPEASPRPATPSLAPASSPGPQVASPALLPAGLAGAMMVHSPHLSLAAATPDGAIAQPPVLGADAPVQPSSTPVKAPAKLLSAGSLSSLLPRPLSGAFDNAPAAVTASAALWDLVYLRTFKMPASADSLAAAATPAPTAGASTSPPGDPANPLSLSWAGTGQSCYHMCSLKEPRAGRLLAGVGAEAMIEYTSRRLLRVYPGPLRLDSSNFNPVPYWAAGVQVRAKPVAAPL